MTHSKADDQERIVKLRTLINDYRYHYHVLNESIMSEAAADSLKHELSQLEAEYPELITPDSPTQRVAGAVSEGFSKVTHQTPMISLADVFNRDEVFAWQTRIQKLVPNDTLTYAVDIKKDGLACALIYEDGVLVQAVTRGDGRVGEDVTTNVRTIENVPLVLREKLPGRTEIRGEIVIFKDDFAKLNERQRAAGEAEFANPRNLAAGTIRQLNPTLTAARPLRFLGYDMLRDDLTTLHESYELMHRIGIATSGREALFTDLNDALDYILAMEATRHDLPFNTDGAVIIIDDYTLYKELGFVGKAPRGAVAYKYAAEEATTVIKDIVISIGRTGAATPVAVFDPVVVAGTTVQHASLHNADEIARLDARIGDTVVIFKAGDIIPQVERILTELRPAHSDAFDFEAALHAQYPELEFVRPDGEVVYRVKGASGPLLLKRALEHFASKGALDIDTLGEKNVALLVDAGVVSDLADIYQLTKEQVLQLDRFAEISAQKLVAAIAEKTQPPLERFIYGIGIRHVGVQTAVDLAQAFGSLEALAQANAEQLEAIDGIGKIVTESIEAWFADPDNEKLLQKFAELGVIPTLTIRGGKLAGQNFVVTGSLERFSRDEVAEKIRAQGGTFQTAVAKDTTYLIVGSKVGESKLKKAKSYGTSIITEEDLAQLLEE